VLALGLLRELLRGAAQHEVAFKRGGAGERAVADSLERRLAEGPAVVLHDRRMPGDRGTSTTWHAYTLVSSSPSLLTHVTPWPGALDRGFVDGAGDLR